MKPYTDPALIGKIVIILLIGFIFFYFMYYSVQFGEGNDARQTKSVEEIIDKALIQCYALEGSYPLSVDYVEKYGVIFDNDKYIYHYEWYGGNIKPQIIVIER